MTLEFVGFALGLINIILLFLCLSLYKDIISVKLLTQQLHQAMAGLAMRAQQQEVILHKISASFNEFTNLVGSVVDRLEDFPLMAGPPMKGGMLYRTLDGKYAGSSLEDLMKKIKDDGAEGNYLSEEEIEQLRRMFNEDDMEEDSDDDFNPDKGKF
jgi:hypothetical protein